MEPFLSIDDIADEVIPCYGGVKHVVSKRITIGMTFFGSRHAYSVSTGFTLNTGRLIPVVFRMVGENYD